MSALRVTRLDQAPPYQPPSHHGVGALRLQGHEAGPTTRFWTGLSYYLPDGAADATPTVEETVYVVLDGELVVTADGEEATLRPHDSVHLAKGQVRSVENRSRRPATLLVTVALPYEET
ncbi:cupin domain-containing protein [Streptomyces sp. BB1-1-1]|uniref:beta-D-galactosidase n=1 Tax=Streptomyces sp. BB1-1-1 TaxID=3074430 RepID=UPI0028779F27|nr:cupin domain-containing protein [Streptomyces sp. BB1-1-1]WND39780.1 cupin domain-containing protein [Streptomyces sp. BB1-1-1]